MWAVYTVMTKSLGSPTNLLVLRVACESRADRGTLRWPLTPSSPPPPPPGSQGLLRTPLWHAQPKWVLLLGTGSQALEGPATKGHKLRV